MAKNSPEKRKSNRHYFAPEEEMVGIFFIKDLDKRVSFTIGNISDGGLYFSSKRGSAANLSKGNHIFLEEIKGKSGLNFIATIELEIRWVLDEKILEHVGFGCKFINLPASLGKQINDYTNSKAARREE